MNVSARPMKMEKPVDGADRAGPMPPDMPMRDAGPLMAARVADHARAPSMASNGPDRNPSDIWASAISRLQAQVTYNTATLEGYRRQFSDLELSVNRLHHEIGTISSTLERFGQELRSRPPPPSDLPRADPADLDVLTSQISRLSQQCHQIDDVVMQMDLFRNRLRKLEGDSKAPTPAPRQPTSTPHRDGPYYETAPPPGSQQRLPPHAPPPGPHHAHSHSHGPPPGALPAMRTASNASQDGQRPPFPGPPPPESQGPHGFRPASDAKMYPPSEPHPHGPSQPPPGAPVPPRAAESLPPPPPAPISGPPPPVAGWRPAEAYHPPPPSSAPPPERREPEPPSSGWAAVNANHAVKRPPEDRGSPYGSPIADGSKRPKLAPLMPNMSRGGHPEDNYGPTSYPPEERGRTHSDSDHAGPPHGASAPPPPPGSQHNFRFITSTAHPEPHDGWRDGDRSMPPHQHPGGRGGRGGRGRGRGSRGGRGGRGGAHHQHAEQQEHGGPEWERTEWANGSQQPPPPNGYHHHHHSGPPPHSPGSMAPRPIPRSDGPHGGHGEPPRIGEYPSTPVHLAHGGGGGGGEHYALESGLGGASSSAGKKTRTKPIRNADGILIRKDGRPDMRSVSSANNLRKVHHHHYSKKETPGEQQRGGAETEGEEGDGELHRLPIDHPDQLRGPSGSPAHQQQPPRGGSRPPPDGRAHPAEHASGPGEPDARRPAGEGPGSADQSHHQHHQHGHSHRHHGPPNHHHHHHHHHHRPDSPGRRRDDGLSTNRPGDPPGAPHLHDSDRHSGSGDGGRVEHEPRPFGDLLAQAPPPPAPLAVAAAAAPVASQQPQQQQPQQQRQDSLTRSPLSKSQGILLASRPRPDEGFGAPAPGVSGDALNGAQGGVATSPSREAPPATLQPPTTATATATAAPAADGAGVSRGREKQDRERATTATPTPAAAPTIAAKPAPPPPPAPVVAGAPASPDSLDDGDAETITVAHPSRPPSAAAAAAARRGPRPAAAGG